MRTGPAHAHATRRIPSAPASVYAVLADYVDHHPQVMPPDLFSDLEVEEGGIGSGTVFHITIRVAGHSQRLHMRVDEPEPGRVLTETNLDTGVVTAFTVQSDDGADTALTRISSEWQPKAGAGGLVDRAMTPALMHWVFGKQLRQLDRYVRSGPSLA